MAPLSASVSTVVIESSWAMVAALSVLVVTVLITMAALAFGCVCGGDEKQAGNKEDGAGKGGGGGGDDAGKKKAAPAGDYIELDAPTPSTKKGEKKDFAAARDPNYRSLMGVDDKFEPSNKAK